MQGAGERPLVPQGWRLRRCSEDCLLSGSCRPAQQGEPYEVARAVNEGNHRPIGILQIVAMSNGSVRFRTPRLWAIGGVLMLGLTAGIMIADARADLLLHDLVLQDPYFIVAHFQYVLSLPVVFGFFAGWYHLFARLTSYAYSDTLGGAHFWVLFIGVTTALVPQVLLALGLASRVLSAPEGFRQLNLISWIGSYISAAGILVFLVNMALSLLRRRPVD